VSNAHIQAKLNQKLKLLQDKKKIIKNLKSLELFEKGVQEEIERITPEKRKFEEWARYFGSEDAKTRQVLKWFNDELQKLNEKADRAHSMRTKILAVQEQIDHQIQTLNIELDQLRTESLRVPSRSPAPPPKFMGRETSLPTMSPDMDNAPVLPNISDAPELIPDSLLEEVLFSKPENTSPDPAGRDEFSDMNFSEMAQPEVTEQNDSTGIKKKEEPQFQNWTKNQFEEPQPNVPRFQEPPAIEKLPEEPVIRDHHPASSRSADYLFQGGEIDDDNQHEITQKSVDSNLNPQNTINLNLDTDYLNTPGSQKFSEPTVKISQEELDEFPKIEADTQRDMKHFRLSQQEMRSQTPPLESKKTARRDDFLDDFLQQTAEKIEKKESPLPIIQKKYTDSTSHIPQSTEFDEFEVFEKGLNRESPERSVEEHKINYIKNQPIRPVEAVLPPVQERTPPKTVETRQTPVLNPGRPEPEPPVIKPAPTQPVKNEPVFRPVVIEKEEISANPPKAVPTPPITMVPKLSRTDVLYLGIDLGTYETTVAASNGEIATTVSAVGWPKDVVSQKMLRKDVLVGEEALRNKLALYFYRPLENGVIKDTDEDLRAAKELIKYTIKLIHPEKYKKVYAVIGAPAQAKLQNHQAILEAAREIIDAVTIVSEPFSVAYGEANIYNTLVIDIGAGTTDICRLKGTMPTEEDQISLIKAGDYIDNQLIQAITNRVKGAQVTKDMARRWKEAHSFVMQSAKPIVIEITVEGKPLKVDITACIKKSCEAIVDDMVAACKSLISTFDPEFQMDLKQNILLAGGGSLIRNLDKLLVNQMSNLGRIQVKKVPNPIEAGARGALLLAMDLTDDYWRGLAV